MIERVSSMQDLYRCMWSDLARLRSRIDCIEPEATPVLFFGNWRTAEVATAGLNPSEDEFRHPEPAGRLPLRGEAQRFLHWEDGALTEDRLAEAFRRAEGYFTLGNWYARWFRAYEPFFEGLRRSHLGGGVVHTDVESPFATRVGIGKVSSESRKTICKHGHAAWLSVLQLCPLVRVVIGHGRGWRAVDGLGSERWGHPVDASDHGPIPKWASMLKASIGVERHLIHKKVVMGQRTLSIYWWKPNQSGMPLCWMGNLAKQEFGKWIAERESLA